MKKSLVVLVTLLMVTGLLAVTGCGSGNPVVGTYTMTDGSKLVLGDDGVASISIPTSTKVATTSYTVKGTTVTLDNPSTGGALVTLKYKDNTLTSTEGTQTEVWVKQ